MPAAKKSDRKIVLTATSGHPDIYSDVQIADTTLAHVLKDHPTGYAMVDDIVATIQNPDAIYESTTAPGRAVILTNAESTDHKGRPLNVFVKTLPTEAFLATALHAKKKHRGKLLRKRGEKT